MFQQVLYLIILQMKILEKISNLLQIIHLFLHKIWQLSSNFILNHKEIMHLKQAHPRDKRMMITQVLHLLLKIKITKMKFHKQHQWNNQVISLVNFHNHKVNITQAHKNNSLFNYINHLNNKRNKHKICKYKMRDNIQNIHNPFQDRTDKTILIIFKMCYHQHSVFRKDR